MFRNLSENRAIYEIMWEKYGRSRQATDDSVRGLFKKYPD